MTNGDKFRKMSNEKLAKVLGAMAEDMDDCVNCVIVTQNGVCEGDDCKSCMKRWLDEDDTIYHVVVKNKETDEIIMKYDERKIDFDANFSTKNKLIVEFAF